MFGFPKTNKDITTYKRNFLKSAIFQLRFQPNTEILNKKKEIIEIFKDFFPRFTENTNNGYEIKFSNNQTPIVQQIENNNIGFELKSQDGQKTLSISTDTISLTISGNVYENFETIHNELIKIYEIMEFCNIETINRIAIRKINVIDFHVPQKEKFIPIDLLEFIINPELLSNMTYFPNTEFIKQNLNTVEYVKESNRLNLRYGIVVPNIENTGHVLIDIDLISSNNTPIDKANSILNTINDEIFNIFNWAICSEAKKHLTEK